MECDLEVINNQDIDKNQQEANFQVEFEDFIYFSNSDVEEDEENLQEEDEDFSICDAAMVPATQDYVTVTSLKVEEKIIIYSCTNPHLKNILNMNRIKRMQLIQLHNNLKDLLYTCKDNIRAKESYINKMKNRLVSNSFLNPWKLAAPYFKDKDLYPSPLNIDSVLKQNAGELSIYDRGPSLKWTPHECSRLVEAVQSNYNTNKHNRIATLKSRLKKLGSDSKEKYELEQIASLENEVSGTNLKDKNPPLNDNSFLDWHRISDFYLRGRHTPQECRAFWNVYMHPFINKKNWTEQENVKIIELGGKYNYQNWEKIAEELNTNRTGFLTCVHYSSILCEKYKKNKFTPEEDKMIIEVVNKCRVGDKIKWRNVAQYFTDRSRTQVFHRYTYYLSQQQDFIKRTKFTEAEDALLLLLVKRFGKNFKKCAEYVPNRTYMQLKNRYNSNLQLNIRKGTFKTEDDSLILEYVNQNGTKRWGGLTKVLKRSRGQLRQRYLFLQKFISANPDSDLSKAPKRRHVVYDHDQSQHNFLKYIADKYKNVNQVPTLEAIENCLEAGKLNNHKKKKENRGVPSRKKDELKNIDSLLTDFFSNAYKVKHERRDLRGLRYNEAITDVNLILNSLAIELEIPDTYEDDPRLDEIDIQILNQFRMQKQNKQLVRNQQVKTLIPPNINSLIGLRGLLIKYEFYVSLKNMKTIFDFLPANREKLENALLWSIENKLVHMDEFTRHCVLVERQQFETRFKSLFYWPSILSSERPQVSETSQRHASKDLDKPQVFKKARTSQGVSRITENGTSKMKPEKQNSVYSKPVHLYKINQRQKNTQIIRSEAQTNILNVNTQVNSNCSSGKHEQNNGLFLIQNITLAGSGQRTVAVPVEQTKPKEQLFSQELPSTSTCLQGVSLQPNIQVASLEIGNTIKAEILPANYFLKSYPVQQKTEKQGCYKPLIKLETI